MTLGDPGGIGPEIVLSLLGRGWDGPGAITVIGSRAVLTAVAQEHGIDAPWLARPAGNLALDDRGPCPDLARGRPTAAGGAAALDALEQALALLAGGQADALVTGPIHKQALALAGRPYAGHTEFLAESTGAADLVMLFDAPGLRVALVTTHIPLARVPASLTPGRVETVVRRTASLLRRGFGLPAPRIGVLGLNPHAGEAGLLGAEEQQWLSPLCDRLRAEGLDLVGPLPPDTAFTPAWRDRLDVHVALYHDQGLIPLKALFFDRACQFTLGLPFVRTSVAHGTAHELVGTLLADSGSLRHAIELAAALVLTGAGQAGIAGC